MTLRLLFTALTLGLVVVGAFASPVRAQRNELPANIITASELSAEQKAAVRQYLESNSRLMESQDRTEMSRGREALLKPLTNRDAAVGFRLFYGETAQADLSRIVAGAGEAQAINALIVAGAVATRDAARVLDAGQRDPRVAVRFAAFAAARRIFRAIEQAAPAIAERDAIDLVQQIADRIVAESDAQVFDAGVRTLIAGAEVARPGFDRLPMAAWKAMAGSVSRRVQTLPCNDAAEPFLPAVYRAGAALGAAAARLQPQLQLDVTAAKAVLELGADIWVHVLKRIEGGSSPPIAPGDPPELADQKREHRAMLSRYVQVGRDLIVFGVSPITNAAVFEPREPADWVREADPKSDQTFIRRVRELLGPGGIVTKPPLNYPGDRFINK